MMTDEAATTALQHRFGSHIPTVNEIISELHLGYQQAARILEEIAPQIPIVKETVLPLPQVPVTQWKGCYGASWKGILHEDSFKHPAKASRALLTRIIDHGFEQGWWQRGDVIGDPFFGIGTTGVIGTYKGLRVVGVELEPKFHATAMANFEMHAETWARMGLTPPGIGCGDSRRFDELVSGILTSPPYAAVSVAKNSSGVDRTKQFASYQAAGGGASFEAFCATQKKHSGDYVHSDGQISDCGAGDLAAAVTSPPYADSIHDGNGFDLTKLTGNKAGVNSQAGAEGYGDENGQIGKLNGGEVGAVITSPPYADTMSPAVGGPDTQHPDGHERAMHGRKDRCGTDAGNIANLPSATVDGCVTSPPWEKGATGHIGADKWKDPSAAAVTLAGNGKGNRASPEARAAQFERDKGKSYGESAGQIGKEQRESYFSAMKQVYEACYRSIQPGGYLVVIVKDYCRKKKRVHLCDDTLRLLCFVGFEAVERIHAMLVEEFEDTAAAELDGTQVAPITRSKKSFFRRVHEAKPGAIRIDYEEVLVCLKPL